MLAAVETARLGRFGPRLSTVGLTGPVDAALLERADAAGANWLLQRCYEEDAPVAVRLPDSWLLVVHGCPTLAAVARTAARYGRDEVDVLLAADAQEWDLAVAAAEAGRARCAGIVTDAAQVVEACRRRRHVDAVLASPGAVAGGDHFTRVCRWGGTGVLTALTSGGGGGWWTARAATADQVPALLRRGGAA